MSRLRGAIENFDKTYGTVAKWIYRLVFYPVMLLTVWAGHAYLELNYVSKETFTASVERNEQQRRDAIADRKSEYKGINEKLDLLLQTNAGNSEKFSDEERRLGSLEKKFDWLSEKR